MRAAASASPCAKASSSSNMACRLPVPSGCGFSARGQVSPVAWSQMQTTVETTEKHTVKLTIEVPPDQVDKDLDRTYRAIAREIKIPGFRPGKAPKPIIDAQVGRDVVLEEFVHQLVPDYFHEA